MAHEEEHTDVTVVTGTPDESVSLPGDACLVVFYGKDIGKRYFLRKTDQIIGRSESANIQIDQDSVSRQHARIGVAIGHCRIYDLGSTNGTYVNDKRVGDGDLRDGDLVRVGQTIFKYLSGSNIERKYHEEIYRLTTIDGLTQAYNKRYFLETFERELTRAQRYRRDLALSLFDIDHFKNINDTFGHLAGDYVLRELAIIVMDNIRRQDVFARYGGEEFALILPEVDPDGASLVCEKLRSLVEQHIFTFADKNMPITISLGVECLDVDSDKAAHDQFIARADAKLYQAKQTGRNRVCR